MHAALPQLPESVLGLQSRAGAMTGSWGSRNLEQRARGGPALNPAPHQLGPSQNQKPDRTKYQDVDEGASEEKMGRRWRPGSSDPGVRARLQEAWADTGAPDPPKESVARSWGASSQSHPSQRPCR